MTSKHNIRIDIAMTQENLSKKKLQAVQTKEKILKAATKCFGKYGYAGCSLDAIAEIAGITKGAIYTHFNSKSELFIAIIEYAYKRPMDLANALKAELTFVDALIELLAECARSRDFPIDHDLWAEILAVANREPNVKKIFLQCQSHLRGTIEDWMREGIESGEINPRIDVKSVAEMIFVIANGLVMRLSDETAGNFERYFKIFETTARKVLQP